MAKFKLHRIGRCFVSFRVRSGFLLFALHRRWRLAKVCPPAKPGYTRWYIGPVEVEHAAIFGGYHG
jgi:hypothetical protein